MKSNNIYSTITAIMAFSLIGSMPSYAQKINDDAELESVQVIIEKNKTIELPEAVRNFEKITVPQNKPEIKPQSYQFIDYHFDLPALNPKMKVLTVKQDSLTKLYSGHVRAGFGNYTTPYLQANYNNKRSDKFNYGVNLSHLSSKNGPVTNSGLSDNEAEVYGTYYLKKAALRSLIAYERNVYRYYGYDQETYPSVADDSIKQQLNNIRVGAAYSNFEKGAKLMYDAGYNFSYFNNLDKISELENEVFFNGVLNIPADRAINWQAGLSQTKVTFDSIDQSRTFVFIRPAYRYSKDKLLVIGGIHFNYENDTVFNTSNAHVYPHLNVSYSIVPNKISAYTGLDGGMQKNTWRSLTRENQYLDNNVLLYHTNKTFDLYAGVKGAATTALYFDARLGYQNYKNLPFYVNNPFDRSRFFVIYDSSVTSAINFHAELMYNKSEKIRLGVKTDYYGYTVSSRLGVAFHRPSFMASGFVTYNVSNKILFKADIYYISGIKANDITGVNQYIKLKDIVDLNLRADYLFSKTFSAFINLNNITSSAYQRYQYYQNKKINLIAGISYSF